MESVDMDISVSEQEDEDDDDDDDDEAELNKLLNSLSGMEKCLLPAVCESDVVVIEQEKNNANTSESNETNNNDISQENRAETSIETINEIDNHSIEAISPPVSPTNSNASTLSRESTPERRLSNHLQGSQVTIAQLLDNKDSDNDVIIDHINEFRKNLETESASDHSDITYIGSKSDIICLDPKSVEDLTLPNNSEHDTKSNDSVVLDDSVQTSPKNSQPEIEPLAIISIESQSKEKGTDPPKEDDWDSDCLIVEHISASDFRQNGLIDLTKPTSDEESSLPLQERTEESLLKEISKIRKALTKQSKKKHKKEKKSKHHHKTDKTSKKKKRSKSKSRTKSPSLDRVSGTDNEDDENETRTIRVSESGQLSVNITNDRSKTDSGDSDGSAKTTKSKSKAPPDIAVKELVEKPAEENSTKEHEPESDKLPEITAPSNETNAGESPPLWNSDCENVENNEKLNSAFESNPALEPNPLKKKLFPSTDKNLTGGPPTKKIFCESRKELQSKFRRKSRGGPATAKRGKPKAGFDKTSKFTRYMSNSDSDSSSKKSRKKAPSVNKFNRFMSDSDSDKSHHSIVSRKSQRPVNFDNDDVNISRLMSPDYGIPANYYNKARSKNIRRTPPPIFRKYRRSRSRSYYRSSSRSPSCYRRRSPSSYRNPSRSHRSPSRSCRSKSRHKTPPRAREYEYRSMSRSPSPDYRSFRSKSRVRRSPPWPRSRSRSYRSPSRSRRSKSRAYRSPSRSHRSKSRAFRSPSPSRSRRSKSRRGTPRRNYRSPSEIRAARKCSPLEDMRQQLRKNNEAAVQQALGGLEKPKKNAACTARIIDDVDLTKSPPSPETSTEANLLNRNAPHQPMQILPHPTFMRRMPVPLMPQGPGMLNQMSVLQISHVYSQAVGPPENYVPMYPHPEPPYM